MYFNRALVNPLYETPSVPLYNMGRAYKAKGDLKGAYASFSEAIRKEPNSHLMSALELNLGVIDYQEGSYPEAEKHLTRSIQRASNICRDALLARDDPDAVAQAKGGRRVVQEGHPIGPRIGMGGEIQGESQKAVAPMKTGRRN